MGQAEGTANAKALRWNVPCVLQEELGMAGFRKWKELAGGR